MVITQDKTDLCDIFKQQTKTWSISIVVNSKDLFYQAIHHILVQL